LKISQLIFTLKNGWVDISSNVNSYTTQLVLIFGATKLIKDEFNFDVVKNKYPKAILIGCSTSGEIMGTTVNDDTLVATAVEFENSQLISKYVTIHSSEESYSKAKELVDSIPKDGLKHVFVLSDGLNVNGSELVKGFRENLPDNIKVTGGLAGDGADFKETYVIGPDNKSSENIITALGFYGEKLEISYGSLGGWDSFGIERLVTKSKNNVLYELDSQPALQLYKSFLGEHATDLPASGLLFPLNLRTESDYIPVVRTILAIDEEAQSLTFAGDIPEGSYVRLMKANFDRLIKGAEGAAEKTMENNSGSPDLAILISCVGRKLVLKQMIEEEVESVRDVLSGSTQLCGFYSYGEISPFNKNAKCELHNQTMTITTFNEN
jgi:hypothetical protein